MRRSRRVGQVRNIVRAGTVATALPAMMFGCAVEGHDFGATHQAIESENGLSMNGLSMNALSMNALSMNALSMNALSMNALSMNALSMNGLTDTEDGVELVKYIVRCALEDGDSITIDVGGVQEVIPGLLGVATEWKTGAIDGPHKEIMSACLLAHVNAFGVSVPVSIRSKHDIDTSASEKKTFDIYEASFFGDVFSETPTVYACTGNSNAMVSSSYRAVRVCSDDVGGTGVSECGVEVLGACSDVCEKAWGGYGWERCWGLDGHRYAETVGTWLIGDL